MFHITPLRAAVKRTIATLIAGNKKEECSELTFLLPVRHVEHRALEDLTHVELLARAWHCVVAIANSVGVVKKSGSHDVAANPPGMAPK